MDKSKKKENAAIAVRTVLALLAAFFGAALSCSVYGAVTAFPVLILASAAAAFIAFVPFKAAAMAFVSAFAVSTAGGEDILPSALFAAACAAVLLCVFGAVKLFAVFIREKKPLLAVGALVLIILPVSLQAFWYGAPWDALNNQKSFEKMISEKYPDQKFDFIRSYYSRPDGEYLARVGFTYAKSQIRATARLEEGSDDGLFGLFCSEGLERIRGEFITLIRDKYPDESLFVKCSADPQTQGKAVFEGKYGAAPEWLKKKAKIEIGMKFSLPSSKDFSEAVSERFGYIKESGFDFESVTFLGGELGVYKYSVTLAKTDSPDSVTEKIKTVNISMEIPSLIIS